MAEENETNETWQIVDENAESTQPEEVLSNNEQNVESSDSNATDSNAETPEVNQSEESTESVQQELEDELTDDEALRILLSERYGQEFSSVDDFESYIKPEETKQEFSYASETLKQIDEYVRNTGRTVEDFIATQSLNPDEMSNEDAVMFMLQRENPGISKEDLKFYMEQTYKIGTEKDSNDYRFGQIALQKEAIKARKEISDFKEHYKTPVSSMQQEAQQAEQLTQERQQFFDNVIEDMNDIEGLTFEIDDKGTEFTFKIDDSNKPSPEEYKNNIENFFNQYLDENGTWNYDALNTDMFILNNIEDIVKSVANHYKSQGTEQVVQELKNPSFEGKPAQADNAENNDIASQIFKAMSSNGDL
tara:strand:- start:167 stop:1252 length:1086 start_codon:yes stop_codon:yes gene_type:complete